MIPQFSFFLSSFCLTDKTHEQPTLTPPKSRHRDPPLPLSLSLSLSLSLFFSFLFFSSSAGEQKRRALVWWSAAEDFDQKREIFVIFVRNDFSQERGQKEASKRRELRRRRSKEGEEGGGRDARGPGDRTLRGRRESQRARGDGHTRERYADASGHRQLPRNGGVLRERVGRGYFGKKARGGIVGIIGDAFARLV
jgi:hypothetical protein